MYKINRTEFIKFESLTLSPRIIVYSSVVFEPIGGRRGTRTKGNHGTDTTIVLCTCQKWNSPSENSSRGGSIKVNYFWLRTSSCSDLTWPAYHQYV